MIVPMIPMITRRVSGDGPKDFKQHLDCLSANGPAQCDGPRHRLLQAFLLRGHHYRQFDRHACPHNNVGWSLVSLQNEKLQHNNGNSWTKFLCLPRFINVSMSLPKTSYVKMVDVWLLFTLLIPFLEVGQSDLSKTMNWMNWMFCSELRFHPGASSNLHWVPPRQSWRQEGDEPSW